MPPLAPARAAARAGAGARWRRYEAVRLFVERARAVRPGLRPHRARTPPPWPRSAGRLDGLPLAIELAAARVAAAARRPALLARLERPPAAADRRRRATCPARQQTLRGAIAWSYDLLDAGRAGALPRAWRSSSGGCTLEAAEAVGGEPTPGAPPRSDVLDGLAALVDKSLLRQDEGARRRAALRACWRRSGSTPWSSWRPAARRRASGGRHAAYFLALAERAEPELRGPEQAAWLDRAGARARQPARRRCAGRWSAATAGGGLRLAGALCALLARARPLAEGRQRSEEALRLPVSEPTRSSRGAPRGRRRCSARRGWRGTAATTPPRAGPADLTVARAAGETRTAAWALVQLGFVARYRGDLPTAYVRYEGGLRIAEQLGDQELTARRRATWGSSPVTRGSTLPARRLLERSLAVARAIGDSLGIAWPLSNLGQVARAQRDYAAAPTALRRGARAVAARGTSRTPRSRCSA